MTFPREGKFTSSHFFASKDVMGSFIADSNRKSWLGDGALSFWHLVADSLHALQQTCEEQFKKDCPNQGSVLEKD